MLGELVHRCLHLVGQDGSALLQQGYLAAGIDVFTHGARGESAKPFDLNPGYARCVAAMSAVLGRALTISVTADPSLAKLLWRTARKPGTNHAGLSHIVSRMAKRKTSNPHHERAMGVLKQFRIIYGSVRQHFLQIERICGVSGSQLWILQEAQKTPGVGVSEVAIRLSIHQSTCSQLVDKLVKRRMIKKTPSKEDQRRVGLHVMKAGEKAIACAPGPAQGLLPDALGSLSPKELSALSKCLSHLIGVMDIEDAESLAKPLSEM
jgi:DNA-binding MarR family transcriptional regulator